MITIVHITISGKQERFICNQNITGPDMGREGRSHASRGLGKSLAVFLPSWDNSLPRVELRLGLPHLADS